MGYVVRMPQLGMSMEEGTVVEWNVEEGEQIDADAEIVIVESEKTTTEVESRESGVVRRILIDDGVTVGPGDPIGVVADPEENLDQYLDEIEGATTDGANATETESTQSETDDGAGSPASTDADVQATPGARKLAGEQGISLTDVDGTGPQGVITETDVQQAIETSSESAAVAAEADEAGVATQTVAEARELSTMQQTVSERLGESYRNAVHVTLNRSFDATTLKTTADAAKAAGADLSLTDLLLKSVAEALETHPEVNAVFEDGEHRLIEEVNIGVAVDLDGSGLVTPVLSDVANLDAEALSDRRRSLVKRVQDDEFTTDDLQGGTFTVSNLGHFGVDSFDPVINPPQIAILGVGRIRDGEMTVSLSFDHRVINGADAARFLDTLVETATDEAALASFCAAEFDTEGGRTTETREIRVETASGLSGTYAVDGIDTEVSFDEPTEAGGTGLAPTPVEHLLGALGSCLSLSFRAMAQRDDVSLGAIDCDIDGRPNHGALEAVDVELRVDSDAEAEAIDRAVTKAERACYVEQSLSDEIDLTVTWARAD